MLILGSIKLVHLWNQNSLKSIIAFRLSLYPHIKNLSLRISSLVAFSTNQVLLQILSHIKEMYETEPRNSASYWVEFVQNCLFLARDIENTAKFACYLKRLLSRVKLNVGESPSKQALIFEVNYLIDMCVNKGAKMMYQFNDGLYGKIKKTEVSPSFTLIYAICDKEIGNLDQALSLLNILPSSDKEVKYFSKITQMSCCFVLQNEITKGTNLFNSLTNDKIQPLGYMEFARALFDVGSYELSTKYFSYAVNFLYSEKITHPFLDGICKMMILKFHGLQELLKSKQNTYRPGIELFSPQLRMRLDFLLCCSMVNENQIYHAFNLVQKIIDQCKSFKCDLWFPEALLLAKHWTLQSQYFKGGFTLKTSS